MKRILLITTTPFYKEKGSSLRIYSIAKVLGQGYKVDLVTYSLGENIEIPNVNIYRTPPFFKPFVGVNNISIAKVLLDLFILFKSLTLLLNNSYQVIHCEDIEAAFIGRILVFFSSKKILVYDLHNRLLDNLELKGKGKNKIFRKTVLWIENFVIGRCNLVILNWNKYKSDELFKNKNTILYYDQIDIIADEKYELFDFEYLVYSGNFEKYQGIIEFLEAYKDCKVDYKIVLIGEPSIDVINFIKENKLSKKVYTVGRLNIGQSNYIIRNSIAGILPRIEGSSMKVIHYLMLGKIVIANNTLSNRELLINNSNSLLYSDTAELKNILGNKIHINGGSEEATITANKIKDNWSSDKFLKNYGKII